MQYFALFHSHLYHAEKKMMQSKLRKASGSGKSIDFGKTAASTVNASTSTEDLGNYCAFFFPLVICINSLIRLLFL